MAPRIRRIQLAIEGLDIVLSPTKDLFGRFQSIQIPTTAQTVRWAAQQLQTCNGASSAQYSPHGS
jgi:hypothetical protein